jgi:hypothetical protein
MKSVNANKINRKSGEAEGSAVRPGWLPKLRILTHALEPLRALFFDRASRAGESCCFNPHTQSRPSSK